jgi:hypothetical protein
MTEQSTNQNTVDMHPNLENVYELSPMQQGMLFHTLYSPGSGVYFEQSIFTIEGDFDFSAFQNAWRHVIARHSILRTGFVWEGVEKPLQIVYRNVHADIEKHDWREFDAAQQQDRLEKFIHDDQVRGFDLARAATAATRALSRCREYLQTYLEPPSPHSRSVVACDRA